MRKLIGLITCLLLVGCGTKNPDMQQVLSQDREIDAIYEQWMKEFTRNDGVTISFYREDLEDEEMLEFNIDLGIKGFGDFAYLQNDKYHAIYNSEEDGYTLEFILKDDKLIVKESHGISYLHTNLSGEYWIKGG